VTNIYYNHNYYIQINSAKELEAVLYQLQHQGSHRRPSQVAELSSEDELPNRGSAHPPPVQMDTKPVWYTSEWQPYQDRGDLPRRDTA
jgi:hypothetical protein